MKNTLAKLMIFFETTNYFDENFKKYFLKQIIQPPRRYIIVKNWISQSPIRIIYKNIV